MDATTAATSNNRIVTFFRWIQKQPPQHEMTVIIPALVLFFGLKFLEKYDLPVDLSTVYVYISLVTTMISGIILALTWPSLHLVAFLLRGIYVWLIFYFLSIRFIAIPDPIDAHELFSATFSVFPASFYMGALFTCAAVEMVKSHTPMAPEKREKITSYTECVKSFT